MIELPKKIPAKKRKKLKKLWEDVYKERKKISGKKKAKYAANAAVYAESLKYFNRKEKNIKKYIKENWNKEKERKINESVNYSKYRVNGSVFITSMDEKLLDKFDNPERKGKIKNMNDEFEREVLFDVKDKYDVTFDPNMYYVINP